jgi:hypothetical protein
LHFSSGIAFPGISSFSWSGHFTEGEKLPCVRLYHWRFRIFDFCPSPKRAPIAIFWRDADVFSREKSQTVGIALKNGDGGGLRFALSWQTLVPSRIMGGSVPSGFDF